MGGVKENEEFGILGDDLNLTFRLSPIINQHTSRRFILRPTYHQPPMLRMSRFPLLLYLIWNWVSLRACAFAPLQRANRIQLTTWTMSASRRPSVQLFAESDKSSTPITKEEEEKEEKEEVVAVTGTVNERLQAELEEAANREKYGARSSTGEKMGLSPFGAPAKSDEEREKAIAEARNLNGVNPVTAIVGSLVAFAGAAAFWTLTGYLADQFASHPVPETQAYFVVRLTAVFRNVVMGLVSLAAGFFGVTGLGIFSLGVRVGYGVLTGELDPTPRIDKKGDKEEAQVDMGSVWEFMTNSNSKRGRR